MYNHCCVPNCKSLRQDIKFHVIPTGAIRLAKWLDRINSESLRKLSVAELSKSYVCHKHFEKRFVTSTSRLLGIGCPTLFTDEEITSGIPSKYYEDTKIPTDHTYVTKPKHNDHNYAEATPKTLGITQRPADQSGTQTANVEGSVGNADNLINDGSEDDDRFYDDAPCESQASESQQENKVRFSWQEPRITACSVEDEFERLPSDLIPQLGTETELHGNTVIVDTYECQDELHTEPATHDNEYHDGYRCNECEEALYRCRYSCLECEDYDICTSCEARGVHGTHYMLRVPGARPHNEVREVLDAVRSHVFNILNKHSTVLNDVDMSEEIKEELEEIKEEDPFHSVVTAMPFSPVEEETPSEIHMIDDEYMSEPSFLNHSEDDDVQEVENTTLEGSEDDDVQELENTTSESIPLMAPKEAITMRNPQPGDTIHRRVLSDRVNTFGRKSISPIGGRTVILRGMSETNLSNHSTTAKTKMAPVETTTMPANIDIKHAKRKIITIVGTSQDLPLTNDCYVPLPRLETGQTVLVQLEGINDNDENMQESSKSFHISTAIR